MKRLLAISLLLFSVSAFAVDSDSDGVDDSNDAFPLDVCASTDTDHDGMPDILGCFIEGFENQTIQPSWSIQPPWSVQEWASVWDYEAHSGNMAARPFWLIKIYGRLVRRVNILVPTTLSFYFQTIPSPLYSRFSIDGVNQHLSGNGSTWILFSATIAAGLHTLVWEGGPCQTFPGGSMCVRDGELFALDDISLGVATSLTEDLDDDNDGVLDTWDNYPLDPLQAGDRDGDGIEGVVDNCPTRSNANQLNTDGDAQGDTCDPDDDNDGIADSGDAYPLDPLQAGDIDADGIDGFIDNCPGDSNDQLNTDGDAQGDVCDYDDDNDGVPDIYDRFSLNAAASSDIDYDGFPGSWNAACDITCQVNSGLVLDNCPSNANADQLNTDGDAQGDVCDADDDNDSVADASDKFPLDPAETLDTDNDGIGNNADTDDDNDGMPDTWEILYGFNPLINDANGDADNDGLTNLQEYVKGSNPTTVVTVKNDYNNDDIAGWYWKGDAGDVATKNEIWQLTFPLQSSGWGVPTRLYPPNFVDQPNWEIVTTGDFNKDGDADVLWRNKSTAQWRVWQIQNGLRVGQTQLADFDLAHAWSVVGAGDTDKDGDDDVILNNTTTGEVLIWQMQNHDITTTNSVGTKAGYVVNRVGDFNKDGDVDLLFREVGTDALVIWEINSNAFVAEYSLGNTGTGYSPACAGDFDADGDDDIMLFSTTTQEKWIIVENYTRTGQKFGSTNTGFAFISCGDYDGDGDMDTVWRRTADNLTRVVLQQNILTTPIKQTVYTNPYGGVDIGSDGYGFVYRGNRN